MSAAEVPNAKASSFLAVLFTSGHASALMGLVSVLVKTIPDAKKKFEEHAVVLPSFSLEVIHFSDWIREYGCWLVLPVLAALAGDYYLMRSLSGRASGWWFVVIALVLFVLLGLAGVAIKLPLMKLNEGLSP